MKTLTRSVDSMKGKVQTTDDQVSFNKISRRQFLKMTGLSAGGLVLGWRFPMARAGDALAIDIGLKPDGYVHIKPDGTIVLYSKHPEIGQGIKTAFPMIITEELDADWNQVKVEQSAVDERLYGFQHSGGSTSIMFNWNTLRQAGASSRAMLVSAAAQQWGVTVDECTTEKSRVFHRKSGRSVGYGELANQAAKLPVPDIKTLKLKDRKDYKLLGQWVSGVDNEKIVTGQPLFGSDTVVEGMHYAVYQKCPAARGTVLNANLDEIKSLPGVTDAFVLDGYDGYKEFLGVAFREFLPGVAIIATSTWAAFSAKKQLKVEWDESNAAKDSWTDAVEQAKKLADESGEVTLIDKGDAATVFAESSVRVKSFYSYPFISHAQMEPQNCTAWYHDDGSLEIWAPTQSPTRSRKNVAEIFGIPEHKITLHQPRIGGGFGRRFQNDFVLESVAISKRAGIPVKLQWTREDDMAHDFYRPGGFHALQASVDSKGKITSWQNHFITFGGENGRNVYGGELRESEFPQPILDDIKVTQTTMPLVTRCGPWRAPGSNSFAFVMQSFLHELSVAAKCDHVEFLINMMGEPRQFPPNELPWSMHTGRAVDVIKLAAEKAQWGKPMPKGSAQGMAFYFCHGAHVAQIAEVSVDANKKVTVHKMTVVVDVGPIINRSGAEAQCEGNIIDAISTMAGLSLSIENGRIQETNYHQYPLLRMGKGPELDLHFIESDNSPTGLGEPVFPPVIPAICNAIYTATGERIKELPITKHGFTV